MMWCMMMHMCAYSVGFVVCMMILLEDNLNAAKVPFLFSVGFASVNTALSDAIVLLDSPKSGVSLQRYIFPIVSLELGILWLLFTTRNIDLPAVTMTIIDLKVMRHRHSWQH